MRQIFFLIVFSIISFHILLNASENPSWINYTHQNVIFDIVHDNDIVWVATGGGLVKLNKNTGEIINYTQASHNLPGNQITSIALDSEKNLWLCTLNNGRGKFKDEIFTSLPSLELPYHYQGVINVDKNNNIWFGDLFWVSQYNGSVWTNYEITFSLHMTNAIIRDLIFDRSDTLWIGARWGLGKFSNGKVLKQTGIDKLINSIVVDRNNNLWLGTDEEGLIKYKNQVLTQYTTNNSQIPDNSIFSLDFDSDYNLWIGTANKGLAKFDGTNFHVFNRANSELPENSVFSVSVDDNDHVWLGLFSEGLVKYDGTHMNKYNISNSGLLNNFVSTFAVDLNNHVWISCQNKSEIVKYNGEKWEYYNPISDLKNNFKHLQFNNEIHIVYNDEILFISYENEPTIWRIYSTIDLGRSSGAKIDREGCVWIPGSNGLLRYDDSSWQIFNSDNSLLPDHGALINKLAIDKQNNLYISIIPNTLDEKGKLIKYDGSNWTIIYTCKPAQFVSAIEIDHLDNLWIGTGERHLQNGGDGLKKYDGSTWQHFTPTNSEFPNDAVTDLCFDDNNNLWISTNCSGLIKFDCNDSWLFYNSKNSGLPKNQIDHLAIDTKGNIWLDVFSNGLTVFNENGVNFTPVEQKKNNIFPNTLTLLRNYPNPFNLNTIISFSIQKTSHVNITIYNPFGQLVKKIVDKNFKPGMYRFNWNGRDNSNYPVSSGLYLYILKTDKETISKKMILLK